MVVASYSIQTSTVHQPEVRGVVCVAANPQWRRRPFQAGYVQTLHLDPGHDAFLNEAMEVLDRRYGVTWITDDQIEDSRRAFLNGQPASGWALGLAAFLELKPMEGSQ